MTGMDERQAFAKLEALKDIRNKTINLEKTRVSLLCDVDQLEDEEKCISEYRRELELLQQEKMAHVEELRQIHADINAMESIIKQSEDSRRNAQVRFNPEKRQNQNLTGRFILSDCRLLVEWKLKTFDIDEKYVRDKIFIYLEQKYTATKNVRVYYKRSEFF